MISDFGVHEIRFTCACELWFVGPAVIWNNTPTLAPLKAAVTTIQPEADDKAVAEKPALVEPWGTVTVAGTVSAALSLERLTTMFPADFDMVTVHALREPAAMLVGTQVSEEKRGVDHSVKLAV